MTDTPPPLTISAIRADDLGSSQTVFLAVQGNPEPHLLPGVRLEKIREKKSHRTLLLRGRHQWSAPVAYGGEQGSRALVYRWCSGGDRCEIQVGPGKWAGLALYRVTGGSSAAVEGWKPVEVPPIEPRQD